MNIIIEVPLKDKSELEEMQKKYPDAIELVESKRLIGSEEIIQALVIVTLIDSVIIINFLMDRLKRNKSTAIKINGIEIEYNSKEELEIIFRTYIENHQAKKSKFLEAIDLEAKGDVTIRVKQGGDKTQINKIKSTDGKIDIDIQQED